MRTEPTVRDNKSVKSDNFSLKSEKTAEQQHGGKYKKSSLNSSQGPASSESAGKQKSGFLSTQLSASKQMENRPGIYIFQFNSPLTSCGAGTSIHISSLS